MRQPHPGRLLLGGADRREQHLQRIQNLLQRSNVRLTLPRHDSNAYTHTHSNPDPDAYAHSNAHANSNTNAHGYAYAYRDANSDSNTDTHANSYSNPNAVSNAKRDGHYNLPIHNKHPRHLHPQRKPQFGERDVHRNDIRGQRLHA